MLKLKLPIVWPPDVKNWLIRKDPDAGQDWRQEEKGTTEDEMAGWHHQFNGHKFEQDLGVPDGQETLACCSQWGCRELDMTEQLNWTGLNWKYQTGYQEIHIPFALVCINYSLGKVHTDYSTNYVNNNRSTAIICQFHLLTVQRKAENKYSWDRGWGAPMSVKGLVWVSLPEHPSVDEENCLVLFLTKT